MVDGAAMCSGGGLPATSGTRSVGSHGGGREDTVLSWRTCLCGPHLLYIVPARQGPTTQLGWAPPTREPSQGPDSVVGPSPWRSILIFFTYFLFYILNSSKSWKRRHMPALIN